MRMFRCSYSHAPSSPCAPWRAVVGVAEREQANHAFGRENWRGRLDCPLEWSTVEGQIRDSGSVIHVPHDKASTVPA